jgi:Sulfotransferase domain
LNFWRKVANSPPGAQQNWSQVLAKYQATVDNPGCCVLRELLAAYPDAKVLQTLHPRGAEAWYTMGTIYFSENMWQFKVLEWLTPFGRNFGDMAHKLIWQRSLQGAMSDKAKAIARYNAYVDDVKAGGSGRQTAGLQSRPGLGAVYARFSVFRSRRANFPTSTTGRMSRKRSRASSTARMSPWLATPRSPRFCSTGSIVLCSRGFLEPFFLVRRLR